MARRSVPWFVALSTTGAKVRFVTAAYIARIARAALCCVALSALNVPGSSSGL